MIFLLLICLSSILVINYFINDRNPIAPSVLFSGGFFLMTIFAAINSSKWSLELDANTFWILVGGITEFSAVTWITNKVFEKKDNYIDNYNYIDIENNLITNRLFILDFIVLFNFILVLFEIRRITGIGNPVLAANYLNASSRNINNTITLSGRASLATIINIAICIWGEWNFSKALIVYKRWNYSLLFAVILSAITPLMNGGRNDTITCLISFYIFIYFALRMKYKNKLRNSKFLIVTGISLILFLIILPWTATTVGRDVSYYTPFDYVSIYVGAELKNLSIFVQNGIFPIQNQIWGSHTFYALIPTISKWFHLNIPRYLVYLPFQYVNGYNLGNVYTIFYPWLYDFGYTGMAIMTFMMAFMSQFIYILGKRTVNKFMTVFPLLYGYFGAFIFLSFFADNIIQKISINLVYIIITWIVLNHLFLYNQKSINIGS